MSGNEAEQGVTNEQPTVEPQPTQQPNDEPSGAPSTVANPTPLEQALLNTRQGNQEPAQNTVATPEPGAAANPTAPAAGTDNSQPTQPGGEGTGAGQFNPSLQPTQTGSEEQGSTAPAPNQNEPVVPDNGNPDLGGRAIIVDRNAVNTQVNGLNQALSQQAIANTQKLFNDQGVRKYGMQDIYQRDEQTGQVRFNNPDDPNHPFATRMEAQQWIDAMNNEIDSRFNKIAQEEAQRLYQNAQPTYAMYEFIQNRWNTMSAAEQELFDKTVAPYTIYGSNQNDIVGYNCDLNAVADMVHTVIENANMLPTIQKAQQQPAKEPTGPALDAHTTGTNGGKSNEPKTLEEAMRLVKQREREARSKK